MCIYAKIPNEDRHLLCRAIYFTSLSWCYKVFLNRTRCDVITSSQHPLHTCLLLYWLIEYSKRFALNLFPQSLCQKSYQKTYIISIYRWGLWEITRIRWGHRKVPYCLQWFYVRNKEDCQEHTLCPAVHHFLSRYDCTRRPCPEAKEMEMPCYWTFQTPGQWVKFYLFVIYPFFVVTTKNVLRHWHS